MLNCVFLRFSKYSYWLSSLLIYYSHVGVDITRLWRVLWQLFVLKGNISVAARDDAAEPREV